MINFAYELDGALSFSRCDLKEAGYAISWRGDARLPDDFDGGHWTAPIVVERNGTFWAGYISGSNYVVFGDFPLSALNARIAAQEAAAACCGW